MIAYDGTLSAELPVPHRADTLRTDPLYVRPRGRRGGFREFHAVGQAPVSAAHEIENTHVSDRASPGEGFLIPSTSSMFDELRSVSFTWYGPVSCASPSGGRGPFAIARAEAGESPCPL